jgi:hypothetical protein
MTLASHFVQTKKPSLDTSSSVAAPSDGGAAIELITDECLLNGLIGLRKFGGCCSGPAG